MAGHIVRFSEFEYYDINHDEEWVRFMATTNEGSYHTEQPRVSALVLRENRAKFREKVMECLGSCIRPCEVELWN